MRPVENVNVTVPGVILCVVDKVSTTLVLERESWALEQIFKDFFTFSGPSTMLDS